MSGAVNFENEYQLDASDSCEMLSLTVESEDVGKRADAFIAENKDVDMIKCIFAFLLTYKNVPMIYYGDEFAMTGAHDPDCRRGMLWKEELQDRNMFEWYKTLIKIRKTYPCITEGKTVYSYTDDENGIIILTKELDDKKITLIFHGKSGETSVSGFTGTNLLTQKTFDGKLGSFETVVLE